MDGSAAPRTRIALARVDECLGGLEQTEMAGVLATALLSGREQQRWQRIRHPRRRREYLAGRLLVKHLFLTRFAGSHTPIRASTAWEPYLELAAAGDFGLAPFGPDAKARLQAFKDLEVVAPDPGRSGRPRVVWRSRDISGCVSVSISHAGGWVVAALSSQAEVGVDLEVVEERSPCFQRFAFTPRERAWVDCARAAAPGATPARLWTLLWAIKEASFKAGVLGQRPAWQTEVVPAATSLAAVAAELPPAEGPLPAFDLRLRGAGSPWLDGAAAVVTPAWVMVAVGAVDAERRNGSWTSC